ncbi:MAG: DUF4838 domain-containing protein [Clostridia bacterium]|nr:DUF4838 domain-containing protein [Clostridia bacterium]
MKRILTVLLAGLLLAGTVPFAAAADTIAVDPTWTILIPAQPTAAERFAADKLQSCLREVFGAQISISDAASEKFIALGAASACDVSEIADNGYRIAVIDGNIHINGTAQRGLQIAAYRFLEEFCGRKVYTSTLTVLPQSAQILVPADTDLVYEPFFESTDTDWKSPSDVEYSMANGLTNGSRRRLTAEMGGSVDYLGGFCHTIGGLCETEKYKDTHPEYLALHDGERTTDQPCLTNPDVLEICTKNVLKILEEKHDPNAPLQIVSVTQNDNFANCQCETCKAFEAAHGGKASATVVNFVNQIADVVKEKGYDNVAIDTFAYYYSQEAPTGIVPRDNVIIRLCSIQCCFSHPLDRKLCNGSFYKDLTDWAKICKRLYIWDYATNYAHTCTVFPDFGVIQKNMQIFYENNVKGVYVEGNYYMNSCDTEFGELRAYMISKCLQNPYCDLESEVAGFCDAYYGPGGQSVKQIVDTFTQHAGSFDNELHIYYGSWSCMRPLTSAEVRRIDGLWEQAKQAAETDAQRQNIERSELSWRWWKACAGKGEFSFFSAERGDNKEQLYNDLLASGATVFAEFFSEDLREIAPEVIRYASPDDWHVGRENDAGVQRQMRIERLAERFPPLFGLIAYFYTLTHS